MTAQPLSPPPSSPAAPRLAYGYARRNGVMVEDRPEGPVCVHRRSAAVTALLEVRRLYETPLAFEPVDDADFDARLRERTGDAADAAADIVMDETDLAALAEDAAAIDDLLDSRDDAPVVRLINAILLQPWFQMLLGCWCINSTTISFARERFPKTGVRGGLQHRREPDIQNCHRQKLFVRTWLIKNQPGRGHWFAVSHDALIRPQKY
jgi:hypothetical protein